jgi:hypothetical protein
VLGILWAMSVPSLPATPAASDAATRRAMQGNRRAETMTYLAARRYAESRGAAKPDPAAIDAKALVGELLMESDHELTEEEVEELELEESLSPYRDERFDIISVIAELSHKRHST